MAFKFDIEPTGAVEALSPLQLAELNNEIMNAYEGLTDSVKQLEDVQEIMENIHTSQQLLAKHGATMIPQLNVDKSLEALCKVEEKLITVDKAVEAFNDQAKAMWEKFKAGVIAVLRWLRDFFVNLFNAISSKFGWVNKAKAAVSKATDEILKKVGAKTVNSSAATEGLSAFYKLTSLYPAELVINIIKDYDTLVYQIYNATRDIQSNFDDYLKKLKSGAGKSVDGVNADDLSTIEKTTSDELARLVSELSSKLKYLKVSLNLPKDGVVPEDIIHVDAKEALSSYTPTETTYSSLQWNSKENLNRFFNLFGSVQRSIGEAKAKIHNTTVYMESNLSADVDMNSKRIMNLYLKLNKMLAKFSFEQSQILTATAKELNPLIDEIGHLTNNGIA